MIMVKSENQWKVIWKYHDNFNFKIYRTFKARNLSEIIIKEYTEKNWERMWKL